MTPDTAEHPQMSVEDFEELVRRAPRELRNRLEFLGGRLCVRHGPLDVDEFEELAAVAPETVRLEYVNGKVEVKAVPDGKHTSIFMWLLRHCMQQRPDLDLAPERGVKASVVMIGHMKANELLRWNRLKGADGDALHALLCVRRAQPAHDPVKLRAPLFALLSRDRHRDHRG